jgi:hypothetical protein
MRFFGCRWRNRRQRYGSLRLRFGTPVSLATSCHLWLRRHQVGFGTGAPQKDIRECCCQGKRTIPDTTGSSFGARIIGRKRFRYPTFHLMHPGAGASSYFFVCWVVPKKVHLKRKRNKLLFLRNPSNSKGIKRQELDTKKVNSL